MMAAEEIAQTDRDGESLTGPQRRCLASGAVRPRETLLRFVVGPDQTVVPDIANRLPGRGLWLTPERRMVEKAMVRKLFARGAKQAVTVPGDLADRVDHLLRQSCLRLLGLARRAGETAAGYDKVHGLLKKGEAALLLQASDGSRAPRTRLATLGVGQAPGLEVIELFTADELGEALGQTPRVHVAVLPGGLAERLRREAARLKAYNADESRPQRGQASV